jgi:subtilase family serine protease
MRIPMRVPSSLAFCGVVLISLAGCTDGPTPPGSSREVLLPLAVVFPAEAWSFAAAVDRWRVQVIRVTGGVMAEQSGSFSPGQQSTEVSISVSLEEQCEDLRIRIELYAGNALYFVGEAVLLVCAGEEPRVQDVPMMPGPGLPDADLVVTGLTHSPSQPTSDEPVTVTAVVGNQALRGAGPSVLWIRLDTETTPVAFSVPALAGGQTFQVQRELGLLPPGSYVVTAIANATSTVTESDETNNQRTDSFSVTAAPRPDLVVSSLTHSPASPTTESSVTVTAVVRNDGGALAGASVLRLQLDGGSATTHDVPSLAPGGTHQVQRVLGTLSAGTHTVTATADVSGAVHESDEGNNQRTDQFSVTPAAWPDLVVSSLTHSPVSPTTESSVTVTAVVRNDGGALAGASVLRLQLDGGSATTHDVPSLAPGGTHQVQRVLGTLSAGTHTVTATADATAAVPESDEGNNQRTDQFSVTPAAWPDLVVSSLTHSPVSPTTESSVTVTAVVRNDGGALAGASVLRLQLDGGSATTHDVPSLAPGGAHQVQRVLGTLSAGTHSVTATADVSGAVPESDEGNNQAAHSFSVALAVPPQLSVSTDSLGFWSPLGGTPDVRTFVVKNVGGGTLTWSHSITDTGGCVSSVSLSPSGGSLGAGASVTVSVQMQGSCPLGTNVSNRSFTLSGSDGTSLPFTLTWLVVSSLSPASWNPRYYVSGVNTCTLPAGTGSWFTIQFDFEDREGDVGAGISTVNVSYRFSTGTTGSYSHPPGDPYISYSGTGYAGTVRTDPCYRFGSATYVDVTLTLVDGGGHASNSVSVRMAKPDGAMAPFPAASTSSCPSTDDPGPGGWPPEGDEEGQRKESPGDPGPRQQAGAVDFPHLSLAPGEGGEIQGHIRFLWDTRSD